eukprot:6180496-Pleurochrysis_carterae.AAC.1
MTEILRISHPTSFSGYQRYLFMQGAGSRGNFSLVRVKGLTFVAIGIPIAAQCTVVDSTRHGHVDLGGLGCSKFNFSCRECCCCSGLREGSGVAAALGCGAAAALLLRPGR